MNSEQKTKLYYTEGGKLLYSRNWPEVPPVQMSANKEAIVYAKYQREMKFMLDHPVIVTNPEAAFLEIVWGVKITGVNTCEIISKYYPSTDAPQSKPEKIYRYPCPKCGKGPVIMFTPDLDICESCDMQMEPQPNGAEQVNSDRYIAQERAPDGFTEQSLRDKLKEANKQIEALKASNAEMRTLLVRADNEFLNASLQEDIENILTKYPEL